MKHPSVCSVLNLMSSSAANGDVIATN